MIFAIQRWADCSRIPGYLDTEQLLYHEIDNEQGREVAQVVKALNQEEREFLASIIDSTPILFEPSIRHIEGIVS